MDILINHWLPILGLSLAAIIPAVIFTFLKKSNKKGSRKNSILAFSMTALSLVFTLLTAAFVLSVGGSLELLLPLLLIVLFFALI